MKTFQKYIKYFILLPVLFIQFSCEETSTASTTSLGALVGAWELSALSGTYIRDVAKPTDSDPTSYALTASWNYAATIMGNDSAKADQTIKAFSIGDTLLNTTSDASAAIAGSIVAMTGTFNATDVYTLTGTYPTIRLDEDACNSYQTVAQITDQGYYGVVYNADNTAGELTITPNASLGDQVLPPFDDATVTFTNDGNTVKIEFTDRDSHDSKYSEVMTDWSETDDRVTMGIAQLPIDRTTGAFTTASDSSSSSGYVMDPSGNLASWGNYATFYYLTIAGEAEFLALTGGITDSNSDGSYIAETIGYMATNNSSSTHSGLPYAALVSSVGVPTNDSAGDFDPTSPTSMAAGGKLTYNVNAVCIPINEIILFDATFEKVTETE